MHPLKKYLIKKKLTAEAFAEKVAKHGVEVTPGYISQIVIGYRYPSRALAFAIASATSGAVTVEKLLSFQPHHAA